MTGLRTPTEVAPAIFECLRSIDAEANIKVDGFPTGLRNHSAFARDRLGWTCKGEVSWTKSLALFLSNNGFPSETEVRFPAAPRNRCDLVVQLDGGPMWLEVKGAFKSSWEERGNLGTFNAHLLQQTPTPDRRSSAIIDIRRLEGLERRTTRYIGFLIVGFEWTKPLVGDIDVFAAAAKLEPTWSAPAIDAWSDAYRRGHTNRLWFWWRETPLSPVGV